MRAARVKNEVCMLNGELCSDCDGIIDLKCKIELSRRI